MKRQFTATLTFKVWCLCGMVPASHHDPVWNMEDGVFQGQSDSKLVSQWPGKWMLGCPTSGQSQPGWMQRSTQGAIPTEPKGFTLVRFWAI